MLLAVHGPRIACKCDSFTMLGSYWRTNMGGNSTMRCVKMNDNGLEICRKTSAGMGGQMGNSEIATEDDLGRY